MNDAQGVVGVGLVGVGWMGQALAQRVASHPRARLAAVHQRDESKARAALTAIGQADVPYEASYEALIARPDVDAVFLCGPNSTHGPQAIAALEAGKHVFCEKPAATRFDEWDRQLQLADARPDLVTFVDYILNFDTLETRLAEMVAAGAFGKLTQVQINYRHPVNIAGDKAWKLSREVMGDAIGMGVIHSLSVMLRLMQSQATPASVFATSMPAQSRPFEADPIWNIQITFDNGACGFCFGNIDTGNGYDAYHSLYGTKGAFVFDSGLDRPQKIRYWSEMDTAGKWIYPLDPERCRREGAEPWPPDTTTPDSGNVIDHQTQVCVDHFLGCILAKRQSFLSFRNSAPVAEVGWAAQMSAALGRPIKLPLDRDEARSFFAGSNTNAADPTTHGAA